MKERIDMQEQMSYQAICQISIIEISHRGSCGIGIHLSDALYKESDSNVVKERRYKEIDGEIKGALEEII